jgi:hypothetical protein
MEVKPEIIQTLHRILRQKTDLDDQLARGPRRVQAARNVAADAAKQLEAAQQELKRLKLLAADKQLHLKQRETKLEDSKAKRNAANSNREFSVLNEQIAADQQANAVLADEILEALDAIDRQDQAIQAAKTRVQVTQADVLKLETELNRRNAELQGELGRVTGELSRTEALLPADIRGEFSRRVKSKGEEALAMVDGGSCGNCHQVLTAQLLDQLSMNRVHICSSCNSILYFGERLSVG